MPENYRRNKVEGFANHLRELIRMYETNLWVMGQGEQTAHNRLYIKQLCIEQISLRSVLADYITRFDLSCTVEEAINPHYPQRSMFLEEE